MLQHVIHVKARIFKDVSSRNKDKTVLLKESAVSYDKLTQLTIFCKQQGIPEDYFEPASYLLMDYWGRFFPKFDLDEVYYEYSGAGDFALTLCFRRNNRKVKGDIRDLKEKIPELLGFSLREVDIHKMERKDKELSERKIRIKKLEKEYDLFKEFAEEDIQKKNSHLDELQSKYVQIEAEKSQLRAETNVQELTIDTLQSELTQLQTELHTVMEELEKQKNMRHAAKAKRPIASQVIKTDDEEKLASSQEPAAPKIETNAALVRASAVKQSVTPPKHIYRENFSQEVLEKQEEFRRQIKERFRQSQRPSGRDKVKISSEAYKVFVGHIDFLDFKWTQGTEEPNSRAEAEFYEWCQKYIEHLPNFKDDLHLKVKRTVLRQDVYVTDRATLHKLQGYALLSQYLELTPEIHVAEEASPPFIHN